MDLTVLNFDRVYIWFGLSYLKLLLVNLAALQILSADNRRVRAYQILHLSTVWLNDFAILVPDLNS